MMTKHSHRVNNLSHQELAEEIGNLYYDSMAELMILLAAKIRIDGNKDFDRGRVRLAAELADSASHLEAAAKVIDRAWMICEPFMESRIDQV